MSKLSGSLTSGRPAAAILAEMTGSAAPEPSGMPLNFEALYRGESPAPGVPAMATPPWDTRAPKDNVMRWHRAGLVRGAVLDIGCGFGDNAVYLAQRGFAVTGLDISPTALSTAERRAADAAVHVGFAVADATTLDGYTDAFDTVIDSGLFHCLDDDARRAYAAAAHRATRDGAGLLLSCFSDDNAPAERDRPRPMVAEQTLRDVLGAAGWQIVALQRATVHRAGWGGEMGYFYVQARRLA